MSDDLVRSAPPSRFRLADHNTMAFPRALREAIPELHDGRVLELDSIDGHAAELLLRGPAVQLKLALKETGKLSGEFVVQMSLQPDAARALASLLDRLADEADHLGSNLA